MYKIFTLPVNPGPVLSKSKEEALITKRIKKFTKNKFLQDKQADVGATKDIREQYSQKIRILENFLNFCWEKNLKICDLHLSIRSIFH